MVWIPAGRFWMGSDDFYPEESPVHEVAVDGFWMDRNPVTVAQFQRFVRDRGYTTTAEIPPDPADYPDADPALLVAGSLVFTPSPRPVGLDDLTRWWSFVPGAQWRNPEGPGSGIGERRRHPVTHMSWFDACAYAEWAGKQLPTEAEWEYAARGGLDRQPFVWGAEHRPRWRPAANVWHGRFPWENTLDDGFARTSPVGHFRPNGYGLNDMAGNVWEWTADLHTRDHTGAGLDARPAGSCCRPGAAHSAPGEPYPRRTIKGGSHLCAPNYCFRYRAAARQGESEETSTGHLGFRCIIRP
ncbi:formylglycine-generating enzyme family protein [Nocardia sp. X0981]